MSFNTTIEECDYYVKISDFSSMFGMAERTPYELIKRYPSKFSAIKRGRNSFITAHSVRNYRQSKSTNYTLTSPITSFYMRKGGVGKTTLLLNLAVRSCMYGFKVLIIDMDSQANITRSFKVDRPKEKDTFLNVFMGDVEPEEAIIRVRKNLHLIPANNKLTKLSTEIDPLKGFQQFRPHISKLSKLYDLTFIDCGGIMDMATFQILACSNAIISPAFPDDYSDEGLELTREEIEKLNFQGFKPAHKIVLNRIDSNFNEKATKEYSRLFEDLYGNHLAKTKIRKSQDIVNATSEGMSIFEHNANSPICDEIDSLFKELTFTNQEQLTH
jgi:chromosome partitioning protein